MYLEKIEKLGNRVKVTLVDYDLPHQLEFAVKTFAQKLGLKSALMPWDLHYASDPIVTWGALSVAKVQQKSDDIVLDERHAASWSVEDIADCSQ